MRVGWAVAGTVAGLAVGGDAAALQPVPRLQNETFEVGAGALGFVGKGGDVQLPSAVAWSMRYGWVQERGLTWEWTYLGAATMVPASGWERATVVSIGEADLKIDIVRQATVHPFIGAGLGIGGFSGSSYQVALTTPVLGGLELDMDDLLVRTRITGRPVFFDRPGAEGDDWTWTLDLASRF